MKTRIIRIIMCLVLLASFVSVRAQYMYDFAWNYSETDSYGYPVVTICVGESHKLQYTYSSSDLSDPFNYDNWVFYEINYGMYTVVENPTVFSLSADGYITGLKAGKAQMKPTGHIRRASGTDRLSIVVVDEYEESEYNNEFSYANQIHDNQPMKFSLSSSDDVDVFKFNTLATPYMYFTVEYLGESGVSATATRCLRYEIYDKNKSLTGSGTLSFKAQGERRSPMYRMVGTGSYGYIRFYFPSDMNSGNLPIGDFTVLATAEAPAEPTVTITSITLSQTNLSMNIGDGEKLIATIEPSDATNQELSWTTSDASVATVSDGTVTAVAAGTAVISATTTDGSNLTASCSVTVIDNSASGNATILRIEFSDGTYQEFPVSDIESMEFVEGEDPYNGHEYVDLGLPSGLKWATCNVGASAPEEYGDYFAWGEILPQSYYEYDWSTYKYCNGSENTMTKYCTSSSYGTTDNKTVLEPEDDAATANWGGAWRMPTKEEQDELRTKCIWTWTPQNGVNGYKVMGPNGNSIFLPAAGCCGDGDLYYAGSYGEYWPSSLSSRYSCHAYNLYFNSSDVAWAIGFRCCGRSVRPVCQ